MVGGMTSPLLTVEEVLERIPISRRTLSTLIKERSIGHLRLGRRIYFSEEDIAAFLASRHVDPIEDEGGKKK